MEENSRWSGFRNLQLENAVLAFEYSNVNVDINGKIDSVFNPSAGVIKAEKIGELIMDKDKIDPEKTNIICPVINTGDEH